MNLLLVLPFFDVDSLELRAADHQVGAGGKSTLSGACAGFGMKLMGRPRDRAEVTATSA